MLLAKANRNSCLNAAQLFQFPGGPLPLPYCGFSKSSFPSSNPPLNSLHSLSADYLGRYLTEQRDSISGNSFKFLPVGRHANLCHLGGELGRRARRLIFQDPSLPLSPLSSGPLLKPVSSLLIHLQSLLVIDSILSACKPDTISPMKIQATAPRFLLNTEATGDSSDRSCRVFQGRGPTTLASGNWIMMGAVVKGSRCKGCGLPWWLRRQRIRLQRGRPGFAIWVGKTP